jgi:hypothetical protein
MPFLVCETRKRKGGYVTFMTCILLQKGGILLWWSYKGISVHLLTLPPLLSPILFYPLNSHSTLCICTHHHQESTTCISNSRWPSHTKVVDSQLPPPLTPQSPQTSIGYIGTRPQDTMAPSASRGLRVRRGLEAWCCIEHYINVLRPNQGSSEHSLWIPPD